MAVWVMGGDADAATSKTITSAQHEAVTRNPVMTRAIVRLDSFFFFWVVSPLGVSLVVKRFSGPPKASTSRSWDRSISGSRCGSPERGIFWDMSSVAIFTPIERSTDGQL